jgi:hypothetical protein
MLRTIRPNWRLLQRNFYYPYRHFDSGSLGIDGPCKGKDNILYDSFDNLLVDTYVGENDPPKRLRRYSQCIVDVGDSEKYMIFLKKHEIYQQSVRDSRGSPRYFEPIDRRILHNKFLTDMIGQTTALSVLYHSHINNKDVRKSPIREVRVDIHQVRQMVYPGHVSTNSPEGIHQDGADCIVSAFVLNRVNIVGGETIVFNSDKTQIYKTTLNPGLGMFQEDRELYHFATGIQGDSNRIGYRDIIGLDFTYIFR